MALEYTLEIATDLTVREVVKYFAQRMGFHITEEGSAYRGYTQLTAFRDTVEENLDADIILLGNVEITHVILRVASQAAPEESHRAALDMIRAALAFFHDRPDDGALLLHNGERIILQRLKGQPVTFDNAWKEYAADFPDDPELDRIQGNHLVTMLPQPYL